MTDETKPRRSRVRIFRDEDGVAVNEKIMATEGVDDQVAAGFARVAGHGLEDAYRVRCVFQDDAGSGMSLVHIWYKSGFILPQHNHNADCVYYVIAGEIHAGSAVLKQGDGLYIPKDHDYTYVAGPEGVELLEFRNAATFNIVFNGNDPGQWTRMVAAAQRNAESWKLQTKPPARK